METAYLTIKEAAVQYSKAEITIRRLVRAIVNDAKAADRNLISPAPAHAQKLKAKRRPFSYSINPVLLDKHFSSSNRAPRAQRLVHGSDYIRLLEQTNDGLKDQVRVKDDQIKSLQHSIENLGERQREMNILMKGLQQQLLLVSGQAEHSERKRWWRVW